MNAEGIISLYAGFTDRTVVLRLLTALQFALSGAGLLRSVEYSSYPKRVGLE
jgi:hypothetical protein